ncbi:Fe-S protein assembly co-chaperone HscB [Cryptococcus depauperatus]
MVIRIPPSFIFHRSPYTFCALPRSRPTRASHTATFPPAPTRPCPSCSKSIPLPLSPCPSCARLMPLPSDLSHHSMLQLSSPISSPGSPPGVFDIPRELTYLPSHGFRLDKADLRSRWLKRQRELHPDKFSVSGRDMVELARNLSGRVNEAYAVLGDELRRAEYILSVHLKGTEETDKMDDPILLAEILEAREELEEATTQEEVDSIRQINYEHVKNLIKSLDEAFSEEPPDLDQAKILAVQLRYWMGLQKTARERSF